MPEKTLIAELPPMTSADLHEFETTVHPWGTQRATRRDQLTVAGGGLLAGAVGGYAIPVYLRRNTRMMGSFMSLFCATCGFVIGHSLGVAQFPNVASNAETTMMRRLWWAQKCSANWSYDKSKFPADWSEKYPHLDQAKLN